MTESQNKTLVSKFGIIQNPTGWNKGKRCWGGGIVKVDLQDWIPWAIDLDEETDTFKENNISKLPSKGLPPWLSQEDVTDFPELIEGIKKSKKKEKNPERLGAAWAEKVKRMKVLPPIPNGWMPSYGSTYSEGPRSKRRIEYQQKTMELNSNEDNNDGKNE